MGTTRTGILVFVAGFAAMLGGIAVLVAPSYDAGATKAEALVATDWGFLLTGLGMVMLTLGGILIKNGITRNT